MSQALLAGDPLFLRSTGPVRERSFGGVRFTARTRWCIMALTHARVLTSATPVGERFWNLKIGKSGFKEATAQPLGSVAHRQSHDHGPGPREVGSRVTTSAITYSDEIHNLGCSQAHSVKL
jgi:hypothetical protein